MDSSDECTRIEALRAYRVLDTAAEQEYDDLTSLAAKICDTPIALISLVDTARQWFKSKVGIAASETPREYSFCAHAIRQDAPFVVSDATRDHRFVDNPLVTGPPNVRFYAGVTLRGRRGAGLGALCVIDHRPRVLSEEQTELLKTLGRQVMSIMELRRVSREMAEALERVRVLEGCLSICSYCSSVRDEEGQWSPIDEYVTTRTDTTFSHGLCQTCFDDKRWLEPKS